MLNINTINKFTFIQTIIFLLTVNVVVADEWDIADKATKRLSPSAFQDLPNNIMKELNKLGCTIPQLYYSEEPVNIISGEFAKKGQKDWAILCSRNRISSILIFWGGNSSCATEMNSQKDRGSLQGTGNGIGYSRAIDIVDESFIQDHYQAYGGKRPPQIKHDAIDDAFVGKGSTVHYCHNGKWIDLSGSD